MNITPIINAVILLVSAILTVYIVPMIKANVSAEKLAKMLNMVKIAVTAAEQLAAANGWNGQEKKEYVKGILLAKGYEIDYTVDAAIEAMVYELHNDLTE